MTSLDNGVPIPAAAAALGVSEKTIRRRIKAGELRAYEITTVRGPAWRVVLPAADAALSTPAGTVVNPLDNAAVAAALLYLVGAIEAQEARLAALEASAPGPPRPPPVLPREVIADTPSTRMGTVVKAVDTEAAPGVWARVRAWWREA